MPKLLIAYVILLISLPLLLNPTKLSAQDDETTIIKLMVVYTEAAKDEADKEEGGIDNVIAQGIAMTNQVIKNSDLNVEVKLGYSGMVNYKETGNSQIDLFRLQYTEDNEMDKIHEWRDDYNIDLVKLITTNSDVGGIAFLPGYPNPINGFSVTNTAHTLTFAHELGHNLGFAHSRNQTEQAANVDGGMFEYSTGWRWTGNDDMRYVSVMTYSEGDNRVPFYSNPDINYKGVPTGSYAGQYAPADNARTLREVKKYIAGYRGPANEADSLVLVDLYNNTNGDNWNSNTNWITESPLRTWEGIDVLAWKLFNLNLKGNNLKGSLPSTFWNLTTLEELYLSNNELSGQIPTMIRNLSSLEWLELDGNNFEGNIPLEINELKDLWYLDFRDNNLSGEIPNVLGNLTELWGLHLSNNNLSGPIPSNIGNLKNLRTLSLGGNQLSGELPAELKGLTNLWYLSLRDNDLQGTIPGWINSDFNELDTIDLSNNQFSGSIPSNIEDLSILTRLDLAENNFSGRVSSGLGRLINLFELDLSDNDFFGALPSSFVNLQNIDYFNFQNTYICISGDKALQDWLQNIEYLYSTDVYCEDVRPDVVQLTSPGNNTEDLPFDVILEWFESGKADYYQVQVSQAKNFSSTIVDTTGVDSESLEVSDLKRGTTYYWRVKAWSHYIDSDWSNVATFKTTNLPIPHQVALISPENGSEEIPVTPNIKWHTTESAEAYTFQLSEDKKFSTLHSETTLPDTSLSLETPLNHLKTYYWRVRAQNVAGTGDWSNVWNFSTETPTENVISSGYPNPFRESTTIEFQIASQMMVTIEVYDVAGRRVTVLHNQEKPPGEYSIEFDARNLSSGTYFVRFKTEEIEDVQALTLIR